MIYDLQRRMLLLSEKRLLNLTSVLPMFFFQYNAILFTRKKNQFSHNFYGHLTQNQKKYYAKTV